MTKAIAKKRAGAKAPARTRSGTRKSKAPKMSEDIIHRAVVQHLQMRARHDIFWFHPPNGGQRDVVTAARMKGLGVIPGVPDLVLIIAGRTYGLELKAEGGRASPAQIAAHARLAQSGAALAITYGLDDALAALKGWGVFRV